MLHVHPPPDAIESTDALLDHLGFPRQVEQHQPPAELEVAPFASGFGRHEQAGSVRLTKASDLGISLYWAHVFVKRARGELHAMTEHHAQHLERLAMRREHHHLLAGT